MPFRARSPSDWMCACASGVSSLSAAMPAASDAWLPPNVETDVTGATPAYSSGSEQVHDLRTTADRGQRQPAADRLAHRREVRRHVEPRLRAAVRDRECDNLVEDADGGAAGDHVISVPVIAAGRLRELRPSGERARETHGQEVRLRSGDEEADALDGRHPLDQHRRHPVAEIPVRAAELDRLVELRDDRVADDVVAVAVDHDPVADAQVEVPVAVGVPQPAALGPFQQHGVRELVPHAAAVTGRDQRARPLEQLERTARALTVLALLAGVEGDPSFRGRRPGGMAAPVFTRINHICIVTNDIDRAVRTWSDRYGVGPWSLWTKDASNMSAVVDGTPTDFAMRVALCQLSPGFRLEIIQPLDDRSPYAKSLARSGGADHVHHVRFEVDDYETAGERLRGLGLPRVLEAEFAAAPGVEGRFAGTYFDTEDDLGFIVEIGRAPPGFAMPEPEQVYPQ